MLRITQAEFDAIKERIVQRWADIAAAIAQVPAEAEIRGWIERVGGATTPAEITISPTEYAQGLEIAHFYRARFTGKKLARLLGV